VASPQRIVCTNKFLGGGFNPNIVTRNRKFMDIFGTTIPFVDFEGSGQKDQRRRPFETTHQISTCGISHRNEA
jgi:hypothetical protein